MADQGKISKSLTQADIDAQAIYAAAASIDPYQAALIKKNAQGNIMSPGVLQSLSALGVDTKSGVASSIADIDAATRETRLADQKKISQERQKEEFEKTFRGTFWRGVKGTVRGATVLFSAIPQYVDATYRTTRREIKDRGVAGGLVSGLGLSFEDGGEQSAKIAQDNLNQTYFGQVTNSIIEGVKKKKFPTFDLGSGFFPSEETGLGHASRQASLSAAKIAIRNDDGKLLGYRPRTLFGDTFANTFTLGNPETVAGANIALIADIAASFALDPGIAKGQQIKQLKKVAEQERAGNAFKAAAKTEERIKLLEKAQDEALTEAGAIRAAAARLKDTEVAAAKAELGLDVSKIQREAAATAAIKSSQSVRIAQSRLDNFMEIEAKELEAFNSAREARIAAEAAAKAPKNIERTEKVLAKQRKQLEEMTAARESVISSGRVSSIAEEDVASLASIIRVTEQKLADAKSLVGESPVTAEALLTAKELEKKAALRLREIKAERVYVTKQVAERTRTEALMKKSRELAARDTLKSANDNRTLSDRLNDSTLNLKDKRKSWELAVERIANVEKTAERPEFAYKNIAEFLTNGHGTRAVDRLVEMTDWKEIWRKSNGKLNHETARAIAAAGTPDELVDVIAPYLLKGDIDAGALAPGRLSRMGESISARTSFAMPRVRKLQGVGARVQSRIAEHEKTATLFAQFNGFAGRVGSNLKRSYTTKVKSGSIINIHDREELLRAVEDFGNAAKLSAPVLDNLIDEIANASSNATAGFTASTKLLDAVFARYADTVPKNMQESFADYTTAFKDSTEKMSRYWATRHAQGANLEYMTLRGDKVLLPGPHLSSELLNSTIYLPPVSELLKMTSSLAKIKPLAKGTEIGDALIGRYWKTIQLVRPAYIIRNIAEEQIRVAAVGHASFFTRPGMALAMWLGRDEGPWYRRTLRQFDTYKNNIFDETFSTGDDALDILDETLGQGMKNSYVNMMNSAKSGNFDERNFRVLQFKNVAPVAFGHSRFFDGVTNQIRMLNSDELARVVAGHNPKFIADAVANGQFRQDAVVDYFLTGPGRKQLDIFADSTPDKFKAFIRTPEGLKTYLFTGKNEKGVDISMLARINETTGGNKSLQQMIATGKTDVGGLKLSIPRPSNDAINSISNSKQMKAGKKSLLEEQDKLAKQIEEMFSDAGNWDDVQVNVPSKNVTNAEKSFDRNGFVEWFFDKSTELEKNSTFGPEFRQAYWDAINTVAKALDSNAKTQLQRVAQDSLTPLQKAGVPVGSKHPVWNAFKSTDGDGPLDLESAHAYADAYARKHVRDLFYNAHEKRLIFHQLRLVAPFAAAWENTISKWAELGTENPIAVYKALKIFNWAQKPESSSIYLMTDAEEYYDPNQGFFFTEPNSGQRQFFVPFAGTVMASIAKNITGAKYDGAPIAFSANPMSFNFAFGAGTMLPGIGPGVTLPLSALATFNGNFIYAMPLSVQEWLFPFGQANFSGGLQTAILPGNWNKIIGGITGMEQTYASNFRPVMNYLASGANYNLDDADDQARLVADTDTFARWESVMRGVIGLVSPMGLIQQGLGTDKDGDLTLQTTLYEDFQTIYQNNDGDWNKAWYDFLNLYGPSQAFALIGSTKGEGPSNWDSYAFVVENPDVATKYKDVWGYIMPGGGLSTEMYQWNVVRDKKQQLTPTEILQKVNNQRFYAAKDALLTRVDAGEFDRDQYSGALKALKEVMGGGPVVEFDVNKRDRIIGQLSGLLEDKRFTDIQSIAGLRDYMAIRGGILGQLGKSKFTGAQSEQTARDYLAAQAEWVVKMYPDFQKMFYAFFANELEGK